MEQIKQPQGGCPAINQAPNKIFLGYNHTPTKQEIERWEKQRKQFWENKNIKP